MAKTRTVGPAISSQSGHDDDALLRLAAALRSAAAGDFSQRLPARRKGVTGELEAAYNQLVERNAKLTAELARLARVVGREGRMTERARLDDAQGEWAQRAGVGQRARRRPRAAPRPRSRA